MTTRNEKWAEYRRIRDVLYSICWDCDRPCSECQLWARETAFGRPHTGWLAAECADAYRMVIEMENRGVSILIDLSDCAVWDQDR